MAKKAAATKKGGHSVVAAVTKAAGIIQNAYDTGVPIPPIRTLLPAGDIDAAYAVVVGGGYVGLEFAQAYRRFGSRVTIIEHGPQMMAREDPDVSEELQRILSGEGIQFLVGAKIVRVDGRSGKRVSLVVLTSSGEQKVTGSDILVAAGRMPNTADIGLDKAGVELEAHGFDFRVIRDNLAGGARSTRDRLVPYCMFTDLRSPAWD